eukprot:60018-Rhodomonas_salina.1
MGCASMRDAWEEFKQYDLPMITTRYVTLRHLWASVQVGLFPRWKAIYLRDPDARHSICMLLRDTDLRSASERGYKPRMLWERARE